MNPISILHIIESLEPGGAQRRLINDLKHMKNINLRHLVCYIFGEGKLKGEIENLGVEVFGLNLKNPRAFWPIFFRLCCLIRKINPDIIHSQLFWADFYGRMAGKLCGVKFLINTIQSAVYERNNPYLFSSRRKKIDSILGRLCTTGFIAVSEFVKQSIVKRLGIKAEKIKVIPNSIDASYLISNKNFERKKIKERLGLNKAGTLILTVGRLNLPKGHRFLIEAIYKLRDGFPDLVLLIAGEGPSKDGLMALTDKLDLKEKVKFLGERNDIRNLLQAADIFVLPTLSEGLPVSLLEAMAMQKLCLASRIEPIKEIIDEGVNGFLFEPGNSDDLARVLAHSLSMKNDPGQIKRLARENIVDKFDAQRTAMKLENYYMQLVSK